MLNKILIANRGAIACRIIRTLNRLGIASVAVYSEADAGSMHVAMATESVCIGPAAPALSYLSIPKIIEAALSTGAQAIHPGYGFLSENPAFVEACEAAQLVFLGPTPEQMRVFGLKHSARALATQARVQLLPGTGLLGGAQEALTAAETIGYPVMLKSSAGGGGIGMQMCQNASELTAAFETVSRLAQSNFSDAGVFLERFITDARHIEVQVFGNGKGEVLILGERDCSLQRRNQKVVEETPAPHLRQSVRASLHDTAQRLAQAVNYRSAGTVEFVVDAKTQDFYFLEVNARLQVEHGVTEAVTGVDIVEWMVKLPTGDLPDLSSFKITPQGHAIQARVYAEDPYNNFQPATGVLTQVVFPNNVRVDTWVERGSDIGAAYDPLLAKLVVHGDDRTDALKKLATALETTRISGLECNLFYLQALMHFAPFVKGEHTTRSLNGFGFASHAIDVLAGGVHTMVQDWPGRTGYWDVGVPPSGPMDALALRAANAMLGNAQGQAALEITAAGPTLRFRTPMHLAICGAPVEVNLDGVSIPTWQAFHVEAGQILKIGRVANEGCRVYLAVAGGLDVPDYLGSKSTFTLGQFGGHGGRVLRAGDVLHVAPSSPLQALSPAQIEAIKPSYAMHWDIAVLEGPHGAPDFFTPDDMQMLWNTQWEVHYNSSRTGVRLIGPKPTWARSDGGEAGLHPSNIHDNAYAIGAIDFTGDMPVILGPDGPSLGGFVCPATVIRAELWKLGQLAPGHTVRFVPVSMETANTMAQHQNALLKGLTPGKEIPCLATKASADAPQLPNAPVLLHLPAQADGVDVVMRRSGDCNLLIEFGPLQLDLVMRFHVHALMTQLQVWREQGRLPGIIDLTPGIRSLQVHFDPDAIDLRALVERVLAAQPGSTASSDADIKVPSRTVWLPLSWDDASTRLAIEKYMQSVRADAPWCPSNIEFIRRINGLGDWQAVQDVVFKASYLVLGLGDVYLGAPVATPIDPRHRLVTTKYNPARTWTPENAVGIGGAYMCVYGMEGPGGYQFVGRTVQMWNRWRDERNGAKDFAAGKPWLLRFFDQIRFYPVSAEELAQWRTDFPAGRVKLRVEEGEFSLAAYQAFLSDNSASISTFKQTQQDAFEAERERWAAAGLMESATQEPASDTEEHTALLHTFEGEVITSQVSGSIWTVLVSEGEHVQAGQTLLVVESMKMEVTLLAPSSGQVHKLLCQAGQAVQAGQPLVLIK